MEKNNFLVRRHLKKVEEFSERERWNNLTEEDTEYISEYLASLPNGLPKENEPAKHFDLLCLKLQLSLLKGTQDFVHLRDKVRDLLDKLEEKQTIPMVKEQLSFIKEVEDENWWIDVTPVMIESLRVRLRDLIKFIDRQQQEIVYTDFKDKLGVVKEVNAPIYQTGFSYVQYEKKVKTYIKEHENQGAIAKLKRNIPLTETDLKELEIMLFSSQVVESQDLFNQVFGQNVNLKLFIRRIIGLDSNVVQQTFAKYLETANFTTNQISFVETIIDYLIQNGTMNPAVLYEAPFTDIHSEGLEGIFDDNQADEIVYLVQSFN